MGQLVLLWSPCSVAVTGSDVSQGGSTVLVQEILTLVGGFFFLKNEHLNDG